MRYREKERIERLEQNGTMDRRRAELRAWFAYHPHGTALQAVNDLHYTYPDHMHVIADSIRMDLVRGEHVRPERRPCSAPVPDGGPLTPLLNDAAR